MKVSVVGIGPGGNDYFTAKAIEIIEKANIVLTSKRLKEELCHFNTNMVQMGVMASCDYINQNKDKDLWVCVAASGDVGFYSIATTIRKNLDAGVDIEFISGISSFQYFTARLNIGYEDIKLVSLHGRNGNIVPFVSYNKIVFTLTGGSLKVKDVVNQLIEQKLTDVTIYVGENLSSKSERIVSGTPYDLEDMEFDDLSVMIVNNENYVNPRNRLKDEAFLRGKSPMTKEAVRTLSVEALEISKTDVVYDIGAGTGSVTIAMARKAEESMVYAIEKEEHAVELIEKNIEKLGSYNIKVIRETAPLGMDNLPAPDKVFIGGSTGRLKDIVDIVISKNPCATFVVNAVTIETITAVTDLFAKMNFETEIICVNISKGEKLGRYNLMKAENPVYIIKGARANEK